MDALIYQNLYQIVFAEDYPGFKKNQYDVPHGDGRVDYGKRHAHVSMNYLREVMARTDPTSAGTVSYALDQLLGAHTRALLCGRELGVPAEFLPSLEYSALRVLYYPPGVGSHLHQDSDLFTLILYRDQPEKFKAQDEELPKGAMCGRYRLHLGHLGEMLGLGEAVHHAVDPSNTAQHSIVYAAMPDFAAVLPSGQTVGEWWAGVAPKLRHYKK